MEVTFTGILNLINSTPGKGSLTFISLEKDRWQEPFHCRLGKLKGFIRLCGSFLCM